MFRYIEDQILSLLQHRCAHPGNMVAADVLEGRSDFQVKHCRRCGAVKIEGSEEWRRPDPNLWRG